MANHWWMKLLICVVSVFVAQVNGDYNVSITILNSAVSTGGVCLDGSPPAYHFDKGHGNGVNNWMVYLSGGGWCTNTKDCLQRLNDTTFGLGSSKLMPVNKSFEGILSPFEAINPNFYSWNRVFVRYCDGASFMSDIEEVDPQTNLHFRGQRIFKAIVNEVLEKGMKNADNVILVGGSAGGLATMLQCDNFRSLVPNVPRVKCISDAGFFFRGQNLPGAHDRRDVYFANVTELHGLNKTLPKSCISKMDSHLCLFPENFIEGIKTPLFLINAEFDNLQLRYWVQFEGAPEKWVDCIQHGPVNCTTTQIQTIKAFQTEMLNALPKSNTPSRGMFIDSCFFHDQIVFDDMWNGLPKLNSKTIAQAVGDWYFDRSSFQQIEHAPFPYNCSVGSVIPQRKTY